MTTPPKAVPGWSEKLVLWLDDGFRIPGTRIRFGLDAVLGALLPGAGDTLTALGSASLVLLALKRRVPTHVLVRILLNIGIDALVGAVPVLGDVFDVAYKSNRRNLRLIQEHASALNEGATNQSAPALRYALVLVAFLVLCLGALIPLVFWALFWEAFRTPG